VTSRRLIPEQAITDAEAQIAKAVALAVDDQRRGMKTAMRSHGLTASAVQPAAVWSATAWAKSVAKHVTPAATAAVATLVRQAKANLPPAVTAGAGVATAAMVTHIVNTALSAGPRLGQALANAAGEDDPLAAVDDALDSGAGWVGDMAGRMASAVGNWVTSDLITHASNQSVLTYTVVWKATDDDRTRDDHAEADGQEVPAGDYFTVGGEQLLYPGDPDGSLGNTENCRCWLSYNDGTQDQESA
jgi:hypothetical protein